MAPESFLWLSVALLCALLLLLTAATLLQSRRTASPRLHRPSARQGRHRHLDHASLVNEGKKKSPKVKNNKQAIQRFSIAPNPPTTHLHTPCSRCGKVNAKRDCRYLCCATCCHSNSESVCRAHGTGYSVAERAVDAAVLYCLYQCDISYSNLKVCPPDLTNIGHQLVTLNLSNNRLKSLPEGISQLSGVQELFLQYNDLTRLPTGICRLTSLVELDVKNNQLTHLPESVCTLKRLIVLNLANNVLRTLPARIGDLVNLQELSLHCNCLHQLPSSFCRLTNLQFLYAGDNKLTYLPHKFGLLKNLEELDLSGCNLVVLPESISSCESLVHLWLTGNKLTTLPFHIGDLQKLTELHIRNNHIKFLPPSIQRLHLYTFTAQNNCFLDDTAAKVSSRVRGCGPPPLLELSARAVYQLKTFPCDTLPSHLSRFLKYPLFCSSCEGPMFSYHHLAKFTFVTVGVCYRVPIYHMYCSGKCVPVSAA